MNVIFTRVYGKKRDEAAEAAAEEGSVSAGKEDMEGEGEQVDGGK